MRWAALALLVIAIVCCPWPADFSAPTMPTLPAAEIGAEQVLRAGAAEVDITPGEGHPLAGFGGWRDRLSTGVQSRCHVTALTLAEGPLRVTIVAADLLLINRAVAEAVRAAVGEADAAHLYFTATHTHGGPGGWGATMLEQFVTGSYDEAYTRQLAGRIAECVIASRRSLTPVKVKVAGVETRDRLINRIHADLPLDERLSGIAFEPVEGGPPLAIIAVFSAHATVLGGGNTRLTADYPGEFKQQLRQLTGARHVLFAAGSVGDARPRRTAGDAEKAAAEYGRQLAEALTPALAKATVETAAPLSVMRAELELPPLRVPLNSGWTHSPALTRWITDRQTHVHLLRVGPALLIGMPGDFAGHLTKRLRASIGEEATVTSFNGDYKGYFVSADVFERHSGYETRTMSFFGPRAGDMLTDLAIAAAERMKVITSPAPTTAPALPAAAPPPRPSP